MPGPSRAGAELAVARREEADWPFRIVDLRQLGVEQPAQRWIWGGLAPAGHVTLLGGHGGAGKSTLALLLAVCVAAGRPCLGVPTMRVRVAFYSAEDSAAMLLARVERACREAGVLHEEVRPWLHVLDAASGEHDPALYVAEQVAGVRVGRTSAMYDWLADYVALEGIGFLVVDNASDAFGADEINRAMVRGFVSALRTIDPKNPISVLLLAHVAGRTTRGPKSNDGEDYSGSTAWHNSVRSRLFLRETEPGRYELQQQKNNLGPKAAPMELEWAPEAGTLRLLGGDAFASMHARVDSRDLLMLVHEFTARGEFVAADHRSRSSAVKLLKGEKGYPARRKDGEVFGLLRDAERDGLLERVSYRDANRKQHERWGLSPAGMASVGLSAPSAPGAP